MKLGRQGQHLSGISAPNSPFQQAVIFLKFTNIPQPYLALRARNHNYIRDVARSDTTTDCQLDPFQQPAFPPFTLEPFDRNLGQTPLRIAATAASTNRDLSDHQALRFERAVFVIIHNARPFIFNFRESLPECGTPHAATISWN